MDVIYNFPELYIKLLTVTVEAHLHESNQYDKTTLNV